MRDRSENAAKASNAVYKFLRTAPGDSHNLNLDGSVTPINAEWGPGLGKNALITRANMFCQNASIKAETFAGLSALTNGIGIVAVDANGDVLLDYTDGVGIKTHHQFTILVGTDTIRDTDTGNAEDVVAVRWTIEKSGRKLWLASDQRLRIIINDDLTELSTFFFSIQGYFADPN